MPPPPPVQVEKTSLLKQAAAARKGKPEESESAKLLREEQELLRNITSQKALKGVKELAKVYTYETHCCGNSRSCDTELFDEMPGNGMESQFLLSELNPWRHHRCVLPGDRW